jgi:hypothetical protein
MKHTGAFIHPQRLPRTGAILLFFVILFAALTGNAATRDPLEKLPELGVFLENVRVHLRSDRLLQSRYTYKLKQTKIELDGDGNLKKTEVDVFDVFPSLDDKYTYLRQTVDDGKPLDPEEIEKQDRSHAKKMEKRARELEKEGIDERTRRLRKEEEEKRKENQVIDELFRMYEFSLIQREIIDGYPAIQLEFRPRPDFKPSSREAKIMSKIAGLAWFCEEDYQLMRANVELIDNVSFGKGLLAKLHKGTKASITRRRINNEVWLPAKAHVVGSARILLIKKIQINTINEYSDYKKFVVDTSIDYRVHEPETESTP